jgi:hypothetical protein
MVKILDMFEQKRHLGAKKGFGPWSNRFRIRFDDRTSIHQLDNSVLKYLIRGDGDSSDALYDLIMGITGLGPGHRFQYLESAMRMVVTDMTLFLLDLLRFEAMYRLGWLDDYPLLSRPIVDLVQGFEKESAAAKQQCPSLAPAHPSYALYLSQFESDRNSFVRRLIPDAIQKFYAEG